MHTQSYEEEACSYGPRANKYEVFPISGEGRRIKNTAVKKTTKPRTECMQYSTGRESPGTASKYRTDETIFLLIERMSLSVACNKNSVALSVS